MQIGEISKLTGLSISTLRYYDKHRIGDILSRITNDVDTINQSLNDSLVGIITGITMIVGILIMMFSINVSMTIVTLVILPISLLISGFVVKKSQKYFHALSKLRYNENRDKIQERNKKYRELNHDKLLESKKK